MPFTLPTWAAAKLFLKSKKFIIPAIAVALLLAIGGGTYAYLNHQTHEAVKTAVTQSDSKATIKTYQTNDAINARTQEIDRKADDLRNQTTKDFTNARNHVQAAPPQDRNAQAPALLIDTLNELDRLRSSRDAGGVPDPQAAAG
jgi:predicted ribosomally synthesized peptide with SipW-like signal peptide